jgi:hypothetical protein
MRKLIIISSYANFIEKERTLIDCMISVSHKRYDIMLVSHLPIPQNIQKYAKYSIYDSENLFLPSRLSPKTWSSNTSFEFKMHTNSHNLAILRNMVTSLNMASGLGYDNFIFTEFDNIFHVDDFDKLHGLMSRMEKENKNMVFFRPSFKNELGFISSYSTLIFGGKITWFLGNLNLPTTIESYETWVTGQRSFVLENIFYNKLSAFESEFIIEPNLIENYLEKSVINKYSQSIVCEPCVSNNHSDFFLFIYNFSDKNILIHINSNKFILASNGWHHRPITTDMDLVICDEKTGEVLIKKFLKLSLLNRDEISKKSIIKFF